MRGGGDASLVPERLLQYEIAGARAFPRYLTSADHTWLRILIEEFQRFEGRRLEALRERLREPLPCYAPDGKLKLAAHVFERRCGRQARDCPTSPRLVRRALFSEAQRSRDRGDDWNRDTVLGAAARELVASTEALEQSLLADLPREQILAMPSPVPDTPELALHVNQALAQGLLQRSSRVSLVLSGNARAVVRQVRLRGLLCVVRPRTTESRAALEISGPLALFRRTILYGRALASLVPSLRACDHFELSADAELRGRKLRVELRAGDPIFPAAPLSRRYDSKLEERFALDFRKLTSDYDLVREPEPLCAGDHLIFPDFAIYHRRDPTHRVLLEIVGFWTPRYLRDKLARLRAAGRQDLILCIDESLNCASEDLPDSRRVLRYKRRIDARLALSLVENAFRRDAQE